MLNVKLSENYGGLIVSGSYDDLSELYDSMIHYVQSDPKDQFEEEFQNTIYGLLYEIRHAYQGSRDIKLVENGLSDFRRDFYGVKKKEVGKCNIEYSFQYFLPEVFMHMMVFKQYFRLGSTNIILDNNKHYICLFYSLILKELKNVLTPIRFNKIIKDYDNSYINDKYFYHHWFIESEIYYLNLSKDKRLKYLTTLSREIFRYDLYDEYIDKRKSILRYCDENNCRISEVTTYTFP